MLFFTILFPFDSITILHNNIVIDDRYVVLYIVHNRWRAIAFVSVAAVTGAPFGPPAARLTIPSLPAAAGLRDRDLLSKDDFGLLRAV